MVLFRPAAIACLATGIHGWKRKSLSHSYTEYALFQPFNCLTDLCLCSIVQWYAGINIDCEVYDTFDDFTVRVWEGPCSSDVAICNPSSGSYSNSTECHDEIYNNGVVTSTENCEREIGRGSALVVSGCCQFFNGQDACSATPYLKLADGQCEDPIQITNFTCVRLSGPYVHNLALGTC